MFRRTFRTIDNETDGRSPWVMLVFVILLLAFHYWFTTVPIGVFSVSLDARVEVDDTAFAIDSPITGKLLSRSNLVLGREVSEGDVLLTFEAERISHELAQATAVLGGYGPQLEALENELNAERLALEAEARAGHFGVKEVASRRREAKARLDYQRSVLKTLEPLHESGVVAKADVDRGKAEVVYWSEKVAAISAEKRKAGLLTSRESSERQVRVAALERQRAELKGAQDSQAARVAALEHRLSQHQVRAPAAGVIAAVGDFLVGSVVEEGVPIATIIAGDTLRLVSAFRPEDVFGRIRSGDKARVEFAGFPAIEYGRPAATVIRVASEVRDGTARVELTIDDADTVGIPLQHGQPVQVRVEIDRATPFQLLARSIGHTMSTKNAAGPK